VANPCSAPDMCIERKSPHIYGGKRALMCCLGGPTVDVDNSNEEILGLGHHMTAFL
jgi:hypothetical protein